MLRNILVVSLLVFLFESAALAQYTDDFNRIDSEILGSSWVETSNPGSAEIRIVDNQVRMVNDRFNGVFAYFDETFSDNQYSQVVAKDNSAVTIGGPGIRINPSSTTDNFTGYTVWTDSGASPETRLLKWVNDVLDISNADVLDSNSEAVPQNAVLRIEAEGSVIRVLVDDVEKLSATDGDITEGKAGLVQADHDIFSFITSNWDDWEGGDLGSVGGYSEDMMMIIMRKKKGK